MFRIYHGMMKYNVTLLQNLFHDVQLIVSQYMKI